MRISIIGSGNIGGAIARGLAKGTMFKASDITCTAQSDETLEKMRKIDPDFILTHDNVEAARNADIIIIAVIQTSIVWLLPRSSGSCPTRLSR